MKPFERLTSSITDEVKNLDPSLFQFDRTSKEDSERRGYSNYAYWRSTWRSFTKKRVPMVLLYALVLLLTFTFVQPFLPNQKSPTQVYLNAETGRQERNRAPDHEFWFGTNSIGQDLWSRVWSGTRTSLLIGLAVGLWNALFGITVGALWGYVRSLDNLLTALYNVIRNIPNSIILILASYILRPSVFTMIAAMCITGWLPMARFVRNQIVIIRDREYNLASRCLGTPTGRLIRKNLLPYLVSVIMLRIALAIPGAIGQEVFLTYIGLGLPISIPSLGNLINEGRIVMMSAATRYQLLFPAMVLSAVTVSFYVMGNAFADASDPKNHV
ncbi:MAG: ABC transporter permease [Pyramidobacter sp.]|jgi:oligopeptide transport system permease protein